MRIGCLILLVVSVAGCSAYPGHVGERTIEPDAEGNRVANLERAARYPWKDDGVCAVREAAGEWRVLVEKCYLFLDLSRLRFQDRQHRCLVANADAATMRAMVGMCLLVQPELVGVVVLGGAVIVAAAIAAELLKCKCMCIGIDDLGRTHGPYPNDKSKNRFTCQRSCLQKGYAGGGFCK